MGSAKSHQLTRFVEGDVMSIVTIGIDLAKNVFAVHGVGATGSPRSCHQGNRCLTPSAAGV